MNTKKAKGRKDRVSVKRIFNGNLKPVFYDTGGGDIYAGRNKKACVDAMLKDNPDLDLTEIYRVPGNMKMTIEPKPEDLESTLAEEYTDLGYGYCIASDNC